MRQAVATWVGAVARWAHATLVAMQLMPLSAPSRARLNAFHNPSKSRTSRPQTNSTPGATHVPQPLLLRRKTVVHACQSCPRGAGSSTLGFSASQLSRRFSHQQRSISAAVAVLCFEYTSVLRVCTAWRGEADYTMLGQAADGALGHSMAGQRVQMLWSQLACSALLFCAELDYGNGGLPWPMPLPWFLFRCLLRILCYISAYAH
jgi:hypothetical protein